MEKFNVKNGLSVGVDKLSIIDAVGSLSAASVTVNGQYTLPSLDGTSSQVIATDGSGNLSFISLSSGSDISSLSANWESTYTTVSTNSAKYDSAYTSLNSNSAKYDSAYTSFNSNSASYIKNGEALGTPSSGTLTNCTGLTTSGLVADAVTLDKMAGGSPGELISYDGSGNPVTVGAGAIGTVLTGQGGSDPPTFQVVLPAGLVSPYAGTTAPSGWLLCAGQAVSRTTYADLFTAIGTTYGVGNGSTTFNLPDLRGRVAAGKDNMNGSSAGILTSALAGGVDGDTLGATGGDEGHLLLASQSGLPQHNHLDNTSDGSSNTQTGAANRPVNANTTTGNAGPLNASAEHNNVQPTIILNYIIKT
jgi:microcystin-dependent protein